MKNGDKVRDTITGFEGIAVAKAEWLYGCVRFAVAPTKLKNGIPQEEQWFDERRLEVVGEKKHTPTSPGGPQRNVVRNIDPK